MKHSTIIKYINILSDCKNKGLKLIDYCSNNNLKISSIQNIICNIKKQGDVNSEDIKTLLSLYNEVIGHKNNSIEDIDTDDRSEISYIRDESGRIEYYSYEIYRKNRIPLSGKLTRAEMSLIYRLYSYYGDALTQRIISRHFVDLSLVDFKRILRAFNITKASAPFAPHDLEEKSEEELREIQLREKENSFLRKVEEDRIRNNERLVKKLANENITLKEKLKSLSDITLEYPKVEPLQLDVPDYACNDYLNLYIADLHLGSVTVSDSIYDENKNYGVEECKRRLSIILDKLTDLGTIENLNLVLLGDNIDNCQFAGRTARLDHEMPYNMQPKDQANEFIKLMFWFIDNIANLNLAINIKIYSVPCGNHSGSFEYLCNKALLTMIHNKYPKIETTLWEQFYGYFEAGMHKYVVCHGKDSMFMKKGFPLNLDDKTKILIYEWLDNNKIYGDNIHFIKGDLHSNTLSSCKRFDYRNVLSLFGASDYSTSNFSRNAWGMSYDLIIGDNLLRGTFENV